MRRSTRARSSGFSRRNAVDGSCLSDSRWRTDRVRTTSARRGSRNDQRLRNGPRLLNFRRRSSKRALRANGNPRRERAMISTTADDRTGLAAHDLPRIFSNYTRRASCGGTAIRVHYCPGCPQVFGEPLPPPLPLQRDVARTLRCARRHRHPSRQAGLRCHLPALPNMDGSHRGYAAEVLRDAGDRLPRHVRPVRALRC